MGGEETHRAFCPCFCSSPWAPLMPKVSLKGQNTLFALQDPASTSPMLLDGAPGEQGRSPFARSKSSGVLILFSREERVLDPSTMQSSFCWLKKPRSDRLEPPSTAFTALWHGPRTPRGKGAIPPGISGAAKAEQVAPCSRAVSRGVRSVEETKGISQGRISQWASGCAFNAASMPARGPWLRTRSGMCL